MYTQGHRNFLEKSVDNWAPLWYNGLASEGQGSSPPRQPQKKVLDNQSKVWYNLGESSERHSNNSLKSLLCTA